VVLRDTGMIQLAQLNTSVIFCSFLCNFIDRFARNGRY